MKKIKAGIIGVGNMGKNHARVYSEIAELVAISDSNEITGRKIAKKYHTKFYNNYEKMLQNENLEIISIAVPTSSHKEVTFACLKKHISTLVEKPIALTLIEAKEMFAYAKKQKTLLMVGHVERYNPAVVKLKHIIEEGSLGKIINLLAIRVGIAPPNLEASDVALDLGIHDVDVFNYLLDSFPLKKKVIKTKLFSKNIADSSVLVLEYGTITATIQTNWITPVKTRKLFIIGTKGYGDLDYMRQKLTLYDKHFAVQQVGSFLEFISLMENPKKHVFISKKEPLKAELLHFISERNNWKASNANEAIRALKVVI